MLLAALLGMEYGMGAGAGGGRRKERGGDVEDVSGKGTERERDGERRKEGDKTVSSSGGSGRDACGRKEGRSGSAVDLNSGGGERGKRRLTIGDRVTYVNTEGYSADVTPPR